MSRDLTIDAVLADPMIRSVMRADHVEPQAFELLLRSIAARAPRPLARPTPSPVTPRTAAAALRDCCCA